MKKFFTPIFLSLVLTLQSTLFSFNVSEAQLRQYYVSKLMGFSTSKTPNEVYFFTNWTADSSRNLEPAIKAMLPELLKQANVFFIGQDSTEMQAINTANRFFLLNPEKQLNTYLQVRDALYTLTKKSAKPTEDEIKKALSPLGMQYDLPENARQKETLDIAASMCARLIANFSLKEAPTVVVYNLTHSKRKVLTGAAGITQASILAAIAELDTPPVTPEESKPATTNT